MFDKGLLTLTDIKKTMRGLVGLYILPSFSYSWSSCQSRVSDYTFMEWKIA